MDVRVGPWRSWALKNWCFWTVVLEKTLESSLDCKEIQPVNLKGNQSWTFIGRTDVEAEAPILWLPVAKSWLTGKDPDAGKDWGKGKRGDTEDEMVGWHHWQWTWVWVNSRSWWWTGRPGVLQFMGSHRVRHNWATELSLDLLSNSRVQCVANNRAPPVPTWLTQGTPYRPMNRSEIPAHTCQNAYYQSHWSGGRQRGTWCTAGGNANLCSHYGDQHGDSSKNSE